MKAGLEFVFFTGACVLLHFGSLAVCLPTAISQSITERPELEGAPEGHRVQPLTPHRATSNMYPRMRVCAKAS